MDELLENTEFIGTEKLSTTHESCNIFADLLLKYKVRHVVVSPGSRNAPIIIALNRYKQIKKYVIVDERSAAFVALGISQSSQEPVVLVCTSGSAVLNYAPAIAEAYYQQLPLIIVSADRPYVWIDQNDSQTINQYGILQNIVKHSYNILSYKSENKTVNWYINRILNEALQHVISLPVGPVHINMQFCEPLYERKPIEQIFSNKIKSYVPQNLDNDIYRELSNVINSHKKVLILASMHYQCKELTSILDKISGGNIVVLSEIIANNNKSTNLLHNIDRILTQLNEKQIEDYYPDLLITFGGSPVSRLLKTFLRKASTIEHWRIGVDKNIIDTMQNLTHRIEISPAVFFEKISDKIICKGDYFNKWKKLASIAHKSHNNYISQSRWSDLKAMDIIMKAIPEKGLNLQISNGSSIRYADIIGVPSTFEGTCFCNRGVSGIDGSTSTALGASILYNGTTLLITGDMSFSYDLNGLTTQYNSKKFKIIVLSNGGGGIFRIINGPSELPEFEQYFEVHKNIPIDKYAYAFGFDYFQANNEEELQKNIYNFLNGNKSAILEVKTNNEISAKTLKEYFNRNKNAK